MTRPLDRNDFPVHVGEPGKWTLPESTARFPAGATSYLENHDECCSGGIALEGPDDHKYLGPGYKVCSGHGRSVGQVLAAGFCRLRHRPRSRPFSEIIWDVTARLPAIWNISDPMKKPADCSFSANRP